jgi:hypothetical protein
MSELSPRARAIIDTARDADEPMPADKNRVRAAVFAHVGIATAGSEAMASAAGGSGGPSTVMNVSSTVEQAPAGVPGSVIPAAPLGGTLGRTLGGTKTLGLKVLVGVALVGGLGGYFLSRGNEGQSTGDTAPAHTRVAAAEPPAPLPAPGAGGEEDLVAAVGASDEDEVVFEPVAIDTDRAESRARRERVRSRAGEPKRQPGETGEREPQAADMAQALKEEQALIAGAKRTLDAGDASGAMRALAEHARRFPDGILAEERSALRVMALCARGDSGQGQTERADFLARWPRSPHAGRVRSACSE